MTNTQLGDAGTSIDVVITVECGKAVLTKVGNQTVLVRTEKPPESPVSTAKPEPPVVVLPEVKVTWPNQKEGNVAFIDVQRMTDEFDSFDVDPSAERRIVALEGVGHFEVQHGYVDLRNLDDLTTPPDVG